MAGDEADLPRWAAGLDAPSFRRVRNLVGQELRARGLTEISFDEDGVEWTSGPNGEARHASLAQLASRCAGTDPSAWSALVRDDVEALLLADGGGDVTLRAGALNPDEVRALRRGAGRSPDDQRHVVEPSAAPPISSSGGADSPDAAVPSPAADRDVEATWEDPGPTPLGSASSATWDDPGPTPLASGPLGQQRPFSWEEEDATPLAPAPVPDELPAPLPPPPPPDPSRVDSKPAGRGAWLTGPRIAAGLLGLALAATLVLDLRAYLVPPEAPELRVGRSNDVLLEATPKGEVLVIAELDGRTLGSAPLRLLVPPGPEIGVFLVAHDRAPKRVVLPTEGRIREHLVPPASDAPTCTARTGTGRIWTYERVDGLARPPTPDRPLGPPETPPDIVEIRGAAVVRAKPEGHGAWLVECPEDREALELDLEPHFPTPAEVRVNSPIGALVHLGHRPLGNTPVRFAVASSFTELRVRLVTGSFVARWVATPTSVAIDFPFDDTRAPELTVPGTALASPIPEHLRPRRRKVDELDAPLFDVQE